MSSGLGTRVDNHHSHPLLLCFQFYKIIKYICTNRDHNYDELILLSGSGNYLNSILNSPAILFQYQIDHLAVKRCPILQSVLVDALLEKFTVTIAL